MNTDEALAFLRQHQPLPSDNRLSDQLIDNLDAVRKHLITAPEASCIPLVLNVFGDGSGFGVYQRFDDVFRCFEQEQLTPHIVDALESSHKSVRYWAAHWAMEFHATEMVEPLRRYLGSSVDAEGHYYALCALAFIWKDSRNQDAYETIANLKAATTDPERLEVIDDVLSSADA